MLLPLDFIDKCLVLLLLLLVFSAAKDQACGVFVFNLVFYRLFTGLFSFHLFELVCAHLVTLCFFICSSRFFLFAHFPIFNHFLLGADIPILIFRSIDSFKDLIRLVWVFLSVLLALHLIV